MKTIDANELRVLGSVIEYLEFYTDYYSDVVDPNTDVVEMRKAIPILKGVMSKKDFKPKTKVIEKNTISDDDLKNMLYNAEKHGREIVDPLFKYCVFSSRMNGTLYLTDDYAKALEKGKSLSISDDCYEFWEIYSIEKIYDGSYKLFKDCYYLKGEFHESSKYVSDKEFLHFDYIRNLFEKIVKI